MRFLLGKHFPDLPDAELSAMTERMARKRVVVMVKADKVMSWDHRKLGGAGP
jgi:hypothetical protein